MRCGDPWPPSSPYYSLLRGINTFGISSTDGYHGFSCSHHYKNSRNSSLLIRRSFFMILLRRPRSISSPGWFGTVVVLPSGCLKNMWLPYQLKTQFFKNPDEFCGFQERESAHAG